MLVGGGVRVELEGDVGIDGGAGDCTVETGMVPYCGRGREGGGRRGGGKGREEGTERVGERGIG